MLDTKNQPLRRPALAAGETAAAPHQKAFEAYVRNGDDDGLRGLDLARVERLRDFAVHPLDAAEVRARRQFLRRAAERLDAALALVQPQLAAYLADADRGERHLRSGGLAVEQVLLALVVQVESLWRDFL